MKWLLRASVVLVAAYLLMAGAVVAAMLQPPERFGQIMKHVPGAVVWGVLPGPRLWLWARRGTLAEGQPAPDFTLPTYDHSGSVTLSSHRGKRPVVLVFGSYTWPPFRRAVPALNELYKQYQDRVAFYVVYIQEAHPIDAWQVDDNLEDDVLVASTTTADERVNIAGVCMTKLGIKLPAIVDGPDNDVERAYTGWPDRLYVIDRDGNIAHKSAAGPFGFKPADVEAALKRLLTP